MSDQNSSRLIRVCSIDGLRGVAAMGVVCFHLSANLSLSLDDLFPGWLLSIFKHGYLGVPVFFVISGFVIALSVGNNWVDRRYIVDFLLRRFIRLNPVYWASILFAFILLCIQNRFLHTHDPFPSGWGIVAYMFYLQDIFSVKPAISVVYWTLCIEVQLYVFYIFSLWLSQRLGLISGISGVWIYWSLIGLTGVYSLSLDQGILINPLSGLFVVYWHYFLMGIFLSQAYKYGGRHYYLFFTWIFIEIIGMILLGLKLQIMAGVITCLIIVCNWRYNLMEKFLGSRSLQYLGAISYTLYLVHPEIGWKAISFGKYILKGNITPEMAGILFLIGLATSIITAHMFHVFIEKPSLKLNLKLRFKGLSR